MNIFKYIDIFGWLLIYIRFVDGWTYKILADKIKKVGLANGHSRKAANLHILINLWMVLYFIFHTHDIYMAIAMAINTGFVVYYWNIIRIFYPYKFRGLTNFKKPSLIKYTINSLMPNKFRKKL